MKPWRIGILVSLLLVSGCGQAAAPAPAPTPVPAAPSAPAPSQPAAPKPLQKVTLRMPWLVGGYDAPFLLAAAKGYYKEAGLDVSIPEGKGSPVVAETVANGNDAFGIVDAAASSLVISKGAPLKNLGVYVQSTPFSLIHLSSVKLDSPADLKGKTVFSSAGDQERFFLPAILAKDGLSSKDINLQLIDPSAYATILTQHPDAFLTGYTNADYLRVKKVSPTAVYKSYRDFGINLYNIGVVTSDSEIQQHPDIVRALMAATTKGWQEALQHPDEAVDATLAAYPNADRSIIAEGLTEGLKLVHTQATQGHVIGWMAASDWQQTLDLLHQYAGVQSIKPLSTYYTDDFLPQS